MIYQVSAAFRHFWCFPICRFHISALSLFSLRWSDTWSNNWQHSSFLSPWLPLQTRMLLNLKPVSSLGPSSSPTFTVLSPSIRFFFPSSSSQYNQLISYLIFSISPSQELTRRYMSWPRKYTSRSLHSSQPTTRPTQESAQSRPFATHNILCPAPRRSS